MDTATGNATAWNPVLNGRVTSLTSWGPKMYAAGEFTSAGAMFGYHLAALELPIGAASVWDTSANGLNTLVATRDVVYASGNPIYLNGHPYEGLVALNVTTGRATAWNPKVNGRVAAIAVTSDAVYIGGYFDSVENQQRGNFAIINKDGTVR